MSADALGHGLLSPFWLKRCRDFSRLWGRGRWSLSPAAPLSAARDGVTCRAGGGVPTGVTLRESAGRRYYHPGVDIISPAGGAARRSCHGGDASEAGSPRGGLRAQAAFIAARSSKPPGLGISPKGHALGPPLSLAACLVLKSSRAFAVPRGAPRPSGRGVGGGTGSFDDRILRG